MCSACVVLCVSYVVFTVDTCIVLFWKSIIVYAELTANNGISANTDKAPQIEIRRSKGQNKLDNLKNGQFPWKSNLFSFPVSELCPYSVQFKCHMLKSKKKLIECLAYSLDMVNYCVRLIWDPKEPKIVNLKKSEFWTDWTKFDGFLLTREIAYDSVHTFTNGWCSYSWDLVLDIWMNGECMSVVFALCLCIFWKLKRQNSNT